LALPGKLRIDIAPLDSMKTILFRNHSVYEFDEGKLKDFRAAGTSADGGGLMFTARQSRRRCKS